MPHQPHHMQHRLYQNHRHTLTCNQPRTLHQLITLNHPQQLLTHHQPQQLLTHHQLQQLLTHHQPQLTLRHPTLHILMILQSIHLLHTRPLIQLHILLNHIHHHQRILQHHIHHMGSPQTIILQVRTRDIIPHHIEITLLQMKGGNHSQMFVS